MNNRGLFLRRCFFLSVQSQHPAFPLLEDSFWMWASSGPVPGARVAANPRLLSCKYHTHRNVGGKEDLEGPTQVWLPSGPFWGPDRWPGGTVLYSYITRSAEENAPCTVHLLHLRTIWHHSKPDLVFLWGLINPAFWWPPLACKYHWGEVWITVS